MKFDNDRALYAINFIQSLRLGTGKYAGNNIELLPWQHNFLSDVYGTIDKRGRRQYTTAYLEIPKKNGKSTLGGGIGLYHTFADGERRGEVYSCAGDRSQASLVFDIAVDMVDQSPTLKKRCKLTLSQKMLEDKVTGTRYKVLSSEAYSKHGLNVSCCIFDELHTQPTDEMWNVMTAGAGDSREEPLWYVISTAGDDPDRNTIGWEVHEKAQKIIAGELSEPHWYCKIWGLEPDFDGDIWDEQLWYQVNPSLGYTIDIEKVRQAALSARNSEREERLFRWLRLNQWVSNKTTSWLPLSLWDACSSSITPADLVGKRCYIGLDLSSTTDLTAVGFVFPPQDGLDKYVVMSQQWIPQDNMKQRITKDRVPYDKWAKQGFINVTPGDVIDYDYIKAALSVIYHEYEVQAWGNDPWGAEKLRQDLERDHGIDLLKVAQTTQIMSPTMKEFERLLKTNQVEHVKNPVTRWAFGNVSLVTDGNENYKFKKTKSVDRIDPIVAILNALYLCIKFESDYSEEREVVAI